MKKIISILLIIAIFSTLLIGCSQQDDTITIAVVQPMSHTSLDQIRDTIISEFDEMGNENIVVEVANANGDTTALQTIFENFKNDGVDIVIPIATPAAQSAKAVFAGTDTPIIFSAVSNPVAAGLTTEDSINITGVSHNIASEEIVGIIENFQPDYEKIGFLYTSSEVNSVSEIEAAKAYCEENSIAYEDVAIANLSELQTGVETLISNGVDAIYTGNDNTIAQSIPAYTDIAYASGVPVYCGADSMVAAGAFATIGVNYIDLAKQTVTLTNRIINGELPQDIPFETMSDFTKHINLQAADRLNLEISDEMLAEYNVLVEKDGASHFNK